MNMNSDFYQTSDLSLATTLSLYFPIESVDKSDLKRVSFIFKRSKEFDAILKSYWREEIDVKPQKFFSQMKIIKTRIYG